MFQSFILFFALSIERTCPDLHFTTDYTLYDCDVTNNKEPWTLNLGEAKMYIFINVTNESHYITFYNIKGQIIW